MEPDSTSELENNINVPCVDKYNTNLVQELKKENDKLKKENVDLTYENVLGQVKRKLGQCHSPKEDHCENRKKDVRFERLVQDMNSMAEENETLRRHVTAKENRIALLEEEKKLLAYQRDGVVFALQQEFQMKEMFKAQNEELQKRVADAEVEMSQCRIQMSGMENERRLISKLEQEKQQALMLVGVWQDKCKSLENLSNRLRIRLKVLSAVDTDEED